jgi:hypothetical protein
VQGHANALKFWLDHMAEIANQNPERQGEIKARLGEAFYNLFNIIALCNDKLPVGDNDCIDEIRMEIINGRPGGVSSMSTSRTGGIKV